MIASRRDAQRIWPHDPHAHDWRPNPSGSATCSICHATTWTPAAWPRSDREVKS